MYYLETIAAIGLKVGLNIQINEFMKLSEYQSRSLFDLGQRSLRFQTTFLFFSETIESFGTKFYMKAYGCMGMKIYTNMYGHMTKVAAMPIYGKNLEIFFSRNNRPMTLKFSL